MDSKKLVLSAIAYAAISQIVHTAGAFLDMSYYTDPANFALWSRLMMPSQGPPGAEFYLLSVVFALIIGLIFTYAYKITRQAFASKRAFRADRYWEVGLKFGLFLFIFTGFTGTLSMYLLFAIPFGLLFSWALQSLVASLAAGVAFARIMG